MVGDSHSTDHATDIPLHLCNGFDFCSWELAVKRHCKAVKRMKRITIRTTLMAVIMAGACSSVGNAQSSDALLNKLVAKGILTAQEADELKKESEAGFDKAYRSKTGL